MRDDQWTADLGEILAPGQEQRGPVGRDHVTVGQGAEPGQPWRHNREEQELHSVGRGDVELYIRTYNTLLRSSGAIPVKALEEVHLNTSSSLHPSGRDGGPDMSAFIYTVWRLPACLAQVSHVVMGQSQAAFLRAGMTDVESWQVVGAQGRRRHWRYDGADYLAVYIGSSSDVDDLAPSLTAYQIEWNKLHALIAANPSTQHILESGVGVDSPLYPELARALQGRLRIGAADWDRLAAIWGEGLWPTLQTIGRGRKHMTMRLLEGSHVGYVRATRTWWGPVQAAVRDLGLSDRPVYFVSSNRHSLVNPLSGFALRRREELTRAVAARRDDVLWPAYERLQAAGGTDGWPNFLYYASKELHGRGGTDAVWRQRTEEEQQRGIHFVKTASGIEVDVQIIELARLQPRDLDPRLHMDDMERLAASRAIVINIDYPLGMQAYHILRRVVESVVDLRATYVLGKAATLNGRIGDVMIADVVYDEHSENTYWLDNCFRAADVAPYLRYGSVLDNQKAVAVKGTFLQNRQYLDLYYRENYTVVEMEAGPYLDALYEFSYPTRYPVGEPINFNRPPCEVGVLHYASDTPYTRGRNLGSHSLSYYGMDSTYATSIAILRRILRHETAQQDRQPMPTAVGGASVTQTSG